jgi:hypothetical protein
MKTLKLNKLPKIIFIGILGMLIIFTFNSCSKKITFLNSAVVPAAEGIVKVKKDNNNNYLIQIHLSNLSEVERLQPPQNAYVVWMVTSEEGTINIGQIDSGKTTLSNKLKASFKTVSSFQPYKIFITAEENANAQYPGMQVVLTTDVF